MASETGRFERHCTRAGPAPLRLALASELEQTQSTKCLYTIPIAQDQPQTICELAVSKATSEPREEPRNLRHGRDTPESTVRSNYKTYPSLKNT